MVVLDALVSEGVVEGKAVVVGDSMGGGPTGLRVALRDAERKDGKGQVVGVVACGTCAEEESAGAFLCFQLANCELTTCC